MLKSKSVVFAYTLFHIETFIQISEKENLNLTDWIIVLPANLTLKINLITLSQFHMVHKLNYTRHMDFHGARKVITQLRVKFSNLNIDTFALASDDHPIAQIILHCLYPKNIWLFEDGVASYISYGFMNYKLGIKAILGKIKNFIFYYPYFKSFHSCGYIKADKYFAYHDFCFQYHNKNQINRLERRIKEKHDTQVDELKKLNQGCIIISQSFIEDAIFSKQDYLETLKKSLQLVKNRADIHTFFYKQHPREVHTKSILEKLKREDFHIELLNTPLSSEEIIGSLIDTNFIFLGLYSSTFIYLPDSFDLQRVFCIKPNKLSHLQEIYDLLETCGLKIYKI